jgi:hypothetical protein
MSPAVISTARSSRGIAGHAEDEVNAAFLAEIHDFGAAVIAVATDGDPRFGQCRRMRRSKRRQCPATRFSCLRGYHLIGSKPASKETKMLSDLLD